MIERSNIALTHFILRVRAPEIVKMYLKPILSEEELQNELERVKNMDEEKLAEYVKAIVGEGEDD